jgi:nucleosome binding factor SPN SPT16 subunit
MNPYFVEEMSNVLDEEKKVKHSALANKLDGKLDDSKWWATVELPSKSKMPSDFDPTQLDWTHGPIIQSGGKFDLKMTAVVDDELLHAGVIIASMGLRYKSYCSIIARTYLVDPNKSQESNYKLLLQAHSLVIKEIRDGANVKDIYAKALGLIKSKKPELEKNFMKNVGAGIGIETRDSTLILNAKSARSLKDGMTLCVTTGFNDIENPNPQDKKSKTYSLELSDTVRVTQADAVIFTGDAPSDLDATSFFFKDDEEPEPTPKKAKKDSAVGAVATKNITKTKLRAERTTQTDEGAEARRRDHQRELAKKKQEEGLVRFAEETGNQNGAVVKKFKRFESYKRDNQFPPRVRDLAIVMDQKNSTIVLPIMGRPVPFHIQTIKNASKSDEGDYAYLRINFLSPGQGVGRKDDQPFEDASAHFVRSLTFRSHDGDRLQDIANQISNMKRDAVKREQEKKEMEDVVEQDKLVEIRSKYPDFLNLSRF